MHLSPSITYFNEQWEQLIPPILQTWEPLQSVLANQEEPKSEFGRCSWNRDVAQGKSLLGQRAKEINYMAMCISSYNLDWVYSACQQYCTVSEVDIKLKNLIKRIDSIWNIWFIWNLICNLVTGSSRSIKNETKKLDQFYSNYRAIIDLFKSQSDLLLNQATTDIEIQIDQCVQRVIENFDSNKDHSNMDLLETDFDNQFRLLEKNLKQLECRYFRNIFMERIALAKAHAREQIFG